MQLEQLIRGLSKASAYPWLVADDQLHPVVEVIQTHISVVFLVGREVFKIHKPVDFGFLDFTTLAARRRDCEAEVSVNAELAPGVYRGVVAVVRHGDAIVIEREPSTIEPESIVEWAVSMWRLPESATFRSLLERRALDRASLAKLATTLARFYRDGAARAAAHPELARLGDLETVSQNVRENFTQLDTLEREAEASGHAPPIDPRLLARLRDATELELEAVRERIHERWATGKIRDTHGDLRLDHVYQLQSSDSREASLVSAELLAASVGHDLLIIDRIEFNDRFRWSDPIADIAFLRMDLEARGAWQLAREFTDDFLRASDDANDQPSGSPLLRFYTGYRATVRAKIAAMTAARPELGAEARAQAADKAEARTRLALVELARPHERPCMVLVAGLPGTGKSVLARGLHEQAGFEWIRSDELRKRLAGLDPLTSGRAQLGEGLYTPAWSERTYAACLDAATEICRAGGRALVDATFLDANRRQQFVEAAIALGTPCHLLVVSAPPEIIRERLAQRTHDPSDATFEIYEAARARWSPIDTALCQFDLIDATGTKDQTIADGIRALARVGLV